LAVVEDYYDDRMVAQIQCRSERCM
jgi:hypothetical protein